MLSELLIFPLILTLTQAMGQCWYCNQVLIKSVCMGAVFSDGRCSWVNNRCQAARSNFSLLKYIGSQYNFTGSECKDKPIAGCWGINKDDQNAFCIPNYDQYECYAFTPNQTCESIKYYAECGASLIKGCIWSYNKCITDSCERYQQKDCYWRYHQNYYKSACQYVDGKCVDQETKDISKAKCSSLSGQYGTFVQFDGKTCQDCVGDYPDEWKKIIPFKRRILINKS